MLMGPWVRTSAWKVRSLALRSLTASSTANWRSLPSAPVTARVSSTRERTVKSLVVS